jgi:1-acyl-sn-glycerol-3-phosphate acyltransferase
MSPRALLFTDPLIVAATSVMGTASLAASLIDRSGRKPHSVARAWARMLLRVSGVKVNVEGLEHIQPEASYVFASNHLSLIDTPLAIANIPVQFRFLAKKSLFRVPFIGGHLKRAGHVAVPREDPRGSLKAMTAAAELIRERGISVLIFPEGGRSEGPLQPFKEGAAFIAIKARVPVVPMAIRGTREVLPSGSVDVRPGSVTLRIGEPIPTTDRKLSERAALTTEVFERVSKLYSAV